MTQPDPAEPIVARITSDPLGHHIAGRDDFRIAHVMHHPYRPQQGRMRRATDPELIVGLSRDYLLRDITPDQAAALDAWLGDLARDITRQLAARIAEMTGRPLHVEDERQ